jgi:hypothetical protein
MLPETNRDIQDSSPQAMRPYFRIYYFKIGVVRLNSVDAAAWPQRIFFGQVNASLEMPYSDIKAAPSFLPPICASY